MVSDNGLFVRMLVYGLDCPSLVWGAVNVSGDVGPSTYMGRNCIDGLVVKLRLLRFLGGLLGAAVAAGVVSGGRVNEGLGWETRGKWRSISHRTRCGVALKSRP